MLMATHYLVLDLSTRGMDAAVYERRWTRTVQKDRMFLERKATPEPGRGPDMEPTRKPGRQPDMAPARESETDTEPSWFQQALDTLAGKMDLSSCDQALVTVSFPEVCFRNISLPFSQETKIAQVLPFELASFLPGDHYVSDHVLSETRFVRDQQLVLTASAPDPMIEDIAVCLWSRRISPGIITPKGHALAAMFMNARKSPMDAVFVCSGPAQTVMTLFVRSSPVMVRTLHTANPAEETVAENVLRLVTGFRHRSGLEARFHVYLARETVPGETPSDGLASDGRTSGELAPGKLALGKPTPAERSPGEPLPATRRLKTLLEQNPACFTGDVTVIDPATIPLVDLLVRKPRYLFNWSKKKFGSGTIFSRFRTELLATAAIGLVVIFLSIYSLYRNLAALEEQIFLARKAGFEIYRQTFPGNDIQAGHSPLLLMQARVKQAMQRQGGEMQLAALEHSFDIPAIDVLHELSIRTPGEVDMQLTRLLLNHGQVTISGTTSSFNHVDKLKNALAQSPLFKTVTIQTADAGRTEGQVVFQFNIDL